VQIRRADCRLVGMIIHTLDELLVYQKALVAAHAVSAIIDRPRFAKDLRLREQLSASSSRVPALIAEGFELKTDRHFAHYLYLARGSSKESCTHLAVAERRAHLDRAECDHLCELYAEIARMLTGLIQHLEREDREHRWPTKPPREADDSEDPDN
jgi:four helix bundle protein